jgi:hypothetical protein
MGPYVQYGVEDCKARVDAGIDVETVVKAGRAFRVKIFEPVTERAEVAVLADVVFFGC